MEPVKFDNPSSGETLIHFIGKDGDRDLKFGETDSDLSGHAVLRSNGNLRYLRETDGRVVADDNPNRLY